MSSLSASWIPGLALGVVFAAALTGAWFWWRRRNRSTIESALKAVAIDHIRDVLIPDGMGGEIHIEHLVLTARGMLVINVKRYEGVIWASDRMDQWTSMGVRGRSTFRNPLPSLYDRVAAVRQLIRDVEVAGFVLFPPQADFSKGRPDDVLLPQDLLLRFAKPDQAEIARLTEAFQPYWEKLRESVKPASS